MAAIKAAKQLLRSEVKKKLASISSEQIQRESDALTQKLVSHPAFIKSKRIAVYLNMADEVRTEGILKNIFAQDKACFVPRYSTANIQMDMLRLNSIEDINNLTLTKWNVRQPSLKDKRENALESGGLDLVVVPGLAFTRDGHRMGRGKGYYDTFLQRCKDLQPDNPPVTIALALSVQLLDCIPTQDHDFVIDNVITAD